MIQHVWSVLCGNASVDNQTRAVSLLNVIETILLSEIPTKEKPVTLSLEIISLWARVNEHEPAEGESKIYLIHNGESITDPIQFEINLTHSIFHRNRLTIQTLPLADTGRYEFKIEYKLRGEKKWKFATVVPFLVSIKDKRISSSEPVKLTA